MEKSQKVILGCSAAAVVTAATAAAVGYYATKVLVDMALDRDEPAIMRKVKKFISGSKRPDAVTEQITAAGERLAAKDIQSVEVLSRSGVPLSGHWYPHPAPKRVLIAMHGWRASWMRDFGMISDFWHDNGSSILFADQRGQQKSGGDHMGFGALERYDCLDWVRWVTDNCGEDIPIYLCGISMGATSVLLASGLELPKNVHGIIADCGFTSTHNIWKHVVRDNLHMSYGLRGIVANRMCNRKIQIRADGCSTVEALEKCKTPVLFIHGTDDHFVPLEMTYQNFDACSAPKRILVVSGAGHGMSYITDKDSYEKAVLDFWAEFDGPQQS